MKKVLFTFLTLGLLIIPSFGFAVENNLEVEPPSTQQLGGSTSKYPVVYLYHGEECPHCQEEIKFLDNLQKELPGLTVIKKEVWHNTQNAEELQQKADELGVNISGVPFTVIGSEYVSGFDNAEGVGKKIRELVLNGTPNEEDKNKISVPIIGSLDLREESLPILTAVIGTLDGFNPCSMWALLTMITLLLSVGSRKKLWIAGWTFIGVSAVSYFLFMTAWLNAFMFLSVFAIVRIVVGLIALGSGIVSLTEFYTKKPEVCEVSDLSTQQKIVEKFKRVIQTNSWPLMMLGVAGVAFSVNLVELMCSIGFPVIYAQALALHNVSTIGKYVYLAFYVFFYMLQNIIVLLVAGFSMKFFIVDSKYTKYSRFIAGVSMVILGLIFIFKPDLLRFG